MKGFREMAVLFFYALRLRRNLLQLANHVSYARKTKVVLSAPSRAKRTRNKRALCVNGMRVGRTSPERVCVWRCEKR